ncbi:peptidase M24 [Athelia psychrophila]|uniref:Peptidase M24 n=1 Tax=Athelia psychrophila TaxID=1759441 RepID=A0A166DV02_9AGAM|nr:peptidase M24 [Fibularhizoctonia sp. CBS 109695]
MSIRSLLATRNYVRPTIARSRRCFASAAPLPPVKPSLYGQPLSRSHPHLVKPSELNPGIPVKEYERRRKALMDSLPNGSIVVAVAAPIKYMSNNIFYKYRQASNFWYLTGFEEPDSAVIFEKDSSSRGYKMTLFSSGTDAHKAQWDGASTPHPEAATIFNAHAAVPITNFASHLKALTSLSSHVYVDLPDSATPRGSRSRKSVLKYLSDSVVRTEYDSILEALSSTKRKALAPEVAGLRAIKSSWEQNIMRAAADISGTAHAKTMRFTQPGLSESAAAAHFEYLCSVAGSQRPAYVPVVASGANARVIHYTSNNHIIQDGEMVLIDAGCEYNGYASDITRTFPANGKFSAAQADLYAAVLSAQKELCTLCTESAGLSMHELHRKSCQLLKVELNQIGFGLQTGDLERVLYPHFLSHPIGIDLHESSHFDRSGELKEGMVITIEPGIYVPPTPNFPSHFHDMGIRIEDDVLIGKNHATILSVNAPKEIADVEGACQGLLGLEPY